jgi:hypothetical protein
MSAITFTATPFAIEDWTVILLPNEASDQLSSRSMGMGQCTIDGHTFEAALEPDGRGSHWFRVDGTGVKAGESVQVAIEPTNEWTRPEVPKDLAAELKKNPKAQALWPQITPKAQWEWIRWVRSTKQAETRKRRVEVACSKMNKGMRRPCCFNSAVCTEPYVSHNWQLLEPVTA